MAEVAIRRFVVLDFVGMADGANLASPPGDPVCVLAVTDLAAIVRDRWVDLLYTAAVAVQARALRLVVDKVAVHAVDLGATHLGRAVTPRAGKS